MYVHSPLASPQTYIVTRKYYFYYDPNKSCGPEKIHPHVIKGTIDGLISPLFYIYTKSLHQGSLPASWKDAIITPIHKKGSKKVPSNYRPISLTSVFCRMLESIIKGKIMTYLILTTYFLNSNMVFVPRCHVLHNCYM